MMTKFNFADKTTLAGREAVVYEAFVKALRDTTLSRAGLATAIHQSHPAIKNVSLVALKGDGPNSSTLRAKFYDGSTATFHYATYTTEEMNVPDKWTARVSAGPDGAVTLH